MIRSASERTSSSPPSSRVRSSVTLTPPTSAGGRRRELGRDARRRLGREPVTAPDLGERVDTGRDRRRLDRDPLRLGEPE